MSEKEQMEKDTKDQGDQKDKTVIPEPLQIFRELSAHQCGAGMDEELRIMVLDEPGPGNACHQYRIVAGNPQFVTDIHFQKGAVAETGPNGISIEALLAVAIDRLEGFQGGAYRCDENAIALDHCWRAIRTLHARTINRANAGTEGRSKK
jgi:hypothetical protein